MSTRTPIIRASLADCQAMIRPARAHLLLRLLLVWVCSALVACGVSSTSAVPTLSPLVATFTPRQSVWGTVDVIAQTQQSTAPALSISNDGVYALWAGADANEARHIMQTPRIPAQILALRAYYPYQQALYPTESDWLMLWLDRTVTTRTPRLLTARVNRQAVAELDVIAVSDVPTRWYSAVRVDDTLYTVWSGQVQATTRLYWQAIDQQGRPLARHDLRRTGDYPALLRADDRWYLYWLENRRIYRAQVVDNALTDITPLARLPLAPDDIVDAVKVAATGDHHYLFWSIQAGDGTHRSLLSIDGARLQAWGIATNDAPTVTTGWQAGAVAPATRTTAGVEWAVPLAGQHDVLPVAIMDESQLGVAYFRAGELLGYQRLIDPLRAPIGAPALYADRNLNLFLTWAEPTTERFATLYLTTTTR
jgi:hypothetical protein